MPPPLQVDLWPFDLESGVLVTCDVGYLSAKVKGQGHQAALVGCSSNYTIYMDDTTFYSTAQSEPLPVDHEYSWCKARWAPQA